MNTAADNSSGDRLADAAQQLNRAVVTLQGAAVFLQPPDLETCEWYELLRQKLIPQLGVDAWLVAAVVGGTNIGKSVIFNHLAGCRASSTSPLASGTRHPVCLVPKGFTDRQQLDHIFPDFELREWTRPGFALQESATNQLFWRTAPELPSNLLVLDTPDIDSDARINWVRADAIRRSADVLITVLTQQKYNDAAVKEFFRKASSEDKAVLVVFNQCLLPEDESYWPVWLSTFCEETGVQPERVYLAPADRAAAESLCLPFFERPWPANVEPAEADDTPRDLREDLARLRFREIRLRTLRGSVRELLSRDRGIWSWLSILQDRSEELRTTSERLSSDAVLKIRDWPVPPASAFASEIRMWWKSRQRGWARRINSAYDAVGLGFLWPLRAARKAAQGEPQDPMDLYRDREWSAILTTIEELFDKLQWMSEAGNRLIKPRVDAVLNGSSRAELIAMLYGRQSDVDFRTELVEVVNGEMEQFSVDSPELFQFYRQLNHVSAAVRPMTSVVLFTLGFGPAGETVAPFVSHAAANAVVHVVADVAGGATAAVAGDAAVGAAGHGAGMLQAWFHRLTSRFTERRVSWLAKLIRTELLGTLPEDLRRAAIVSHSAEWHDVTKTLALIEQLLHETEANES